MTDSIEENLEQQQWWEQKQPPVLYVHHPVTSEYLGTCAADPSPLEPGVWLHPANTTDQEPPETGENEAAVWDGSAWQVVFDHRGATYYTRDGKQHEIDTLGMVPPDDALDSPPELDDLLTDEEKTEIQAIAVRAARDQRLADADVLIFKAEDAGVDTAALRAYRQALRDLPQQNGFPWDVEWPEIPA